MNQIPVYQEVHHAHPVQDRLVFNMVMERM